jgi:hypothetical protein
MWDLSLVALNLPSQYFDLRDANPFLTWRPNEKKVCYYRRRNTSFAHEKLSMTGNNSRKIDALIRPPTLFNTSERPDELERNSSEGQR